jgi:hypothetical protein
MMAELTAVEAVRQAVASWEGVTTHDHRFGGIEFRLGRRELGHLHRSFADLPFPRRIRDELVRAGRAKPHHILPEFGWVTVPMRTATEVYGKTTNAVPPIEESTYLNNSSGSRRGGHNRAAINVARRFDLWSSTSASKNNSDFKTSFALDTIWTASDYSPDCLCNDVK